MNRQALSGTGVALVTPFEHGAIDFPALERIIHHAIEGGVDFLVSLGTTGEATTLTDAEAEKVLAFTREVNKGRVPLVNGSFGGNDTAALVHKLQNTDLSGYDYVMSASPAYNKPTQEGLYQHFLRLAEASPLPIIIYNVPGRTAQNMEADTILRLARASEQFVAVKEASGDLVQAMHILKDRPEHFTLLSGDDPLTLPLLGAGADGVISVIANGFPTQFAGMVRAAGSGDFKLARFLNELLLDLHPWLYTDGNPAGIKAALEILGYCRKEVRLPLVPVTDRTYANIRSEVQKVLAAHPA